MECKNCSNPLPENFNFCPNCGAKVIHYRLTFKNLWHEVIEGFFDLDNTFFRTFIHLFTKPAEVIDGYISGIRRKYLNPIGYLGIALTLSGVLYFILQKVFVVEMDMDVFNQGVNPELYKKIMPILGDYQSLVFILFIPIFGIAGWLTFNKRSYLFTEYLVLMLYTLAQWSIISFPISLIVLIVSPQDFIIMSTIMLPLMLAYVIYVIQRINKFTIGQFILRTCMFMILAMIGYFGLIIALYIILFVTGTINLEDFKPVEK
ncbi:MAG: DUF3667 domain-containing protein [Eudoraea sp.]|nr:DUF3667 domain-containing protein [Eudoraea sp.]NNL01441.1 DUF3667 domain-containing protein [Eudoraea sp.]